MQDLRRVVRAVRRRLMLQAWLRALPWYGCVGLLLACALLAVDKFLPLGAPVWAWPAIGAAASLATASYLVWRHRPSELGAAIELDRRLGLNERISSSYALDLVALDTPAGQALVQDACGSLNRLCVTDQFRLSPGRWLWLPIVPAAGVLAIVFLLRPAADAQREAAAATATTQQQQIERSARVLRKKLAQQREAAQQQGLDSADDLFARIEQGASQVSQGKSADRKQALVKLNDLAKQLAERQNDLAAGSKLADQLKQLNGIGQGPAEKLATALEQGDLAGAAHEIKALAERLNRGELNAADRQQLAAQINKLQHKVEALAQVQRQLEKDLAQQIADKRAAGRADEADQLQQQLNRLNQQRQAQSLEKMANRLGQFAECLGRNQDQQASGELAGLQAELDQLKSQMAESELIGQALDEIADAKESTACKKCAGEGCRECQGRMAGQRPGDGIGRGHGAGWRQDDKLETSSYDTRVRQKIGRGPAEATGLADGPNSRGRVAQEIRTQWSAAAAQEADPLADQPLPSEYREHAKKYFDSLREGR